MSRSHNEHMLLQLLFTAPMLALAWIAALIMALNLLVDVVQAWLNPKVRLEA